MKAANFIFKVASIVLVVAAAACFILANVEKISDGLLSIREQFAARRRHCPCSCDEIDDYEDWDF